MVTVLRKRGLRVVIYLDDHLPAHVHVIGDGETKVQLGSGEGDPKLVWSRGCSRSEIRTALRIVSEHRADLLRRWSEIHG